MKLQRFLSLPVISSISLMGFVYITVLLLIHDWVGLYTSPGILNASFFTILCSLCLFSFLVCVLKDPGFVPPSYHPDLEHIHVINRASGKDSLEQTRCDKCYTYKPPRTHHCRVCRRCILKMDHHCVWINNCVGYRNYKAFFLLVLYATTASIHSMAIFISFVLQKDWNLLKGGYLKIYYVTCGMILISLTMILFTLLAWHCYLVFHNMTTIEYHASKRAQWLARKSGQSYRHPFNIGAYKNITSILGPNMLQWFFPTAISHLKDGISFPTPYDSA